MKKAALLALFALTVTTGAYAQDSKKDDAPDPDRKICKTEKVTGSLMRKRRTCMTQAQWDDLAKRGRDAADQIMYNGSRSTGESINYGGPAG